VSKTPQVMKGFLAEPDPRVRANAIEALWGMDSDQACAVMREAADDPNNRVAGNALVGLYRAGETLAIPRILQLACHPKAEFRTTAAWIMEQSGSPRFLPALAHMVRESDPRARAWVFRAITKLKRAASGAAGLARLRVHLIGPSVRSGSSRSIRAIIATEEGREIPRLPATSILLWEDSRIVTDYTVRPLERPDSIDLGLLLPRGVTGERALASLRPLKRSQDRWQECRYADASTALPLVEAVSVGRRMLMVVPASRSDPSEAAQWGHLLARARESAVAVQLVADSPEDPGKVAKACEHAYLLLLCGYEIASQGGADTAEPVETKLEVYSGQSYGVDVLKPGA
jgi:hypothetical protein